MSEQDEAYADVKRLVDETKVACDAVLERSALWLAVHPIQHHRLKRDMMRKRRAMIAARDRYLTLMGRPIPAWPRA